MSNDSNRGGSSVGVSDRSRALAGKYLTFELAGESYGLAILKVREIIGLLNIAAVPRTPHFIKGVVNLRGKVIPVVDLRLKFGLPEVESTEQTCIIVVDLGKVQTGLVVDKVSEVLDIPADVIDETPSFGASVETDFILGMGKVSDSVKILLDIEKVLGEADMRDVAGLSESSAHGG